jgi:TP901 family phage tail tape measure protein
MRSGFVGAFPAILALGVLRRAAAGLRTLVAPAIELEGALARLRAFGAPGEIAGGIDAFSESAVRASRTLGRTLGVSTPDLINALTELSKKGLEGQDALNALGTTATVATLSGQSVAETAEQAAVLFQVWNFEADELNFRMAQAFLTASKARLGFDEITDALTRSASGAALAKPQFEDFLFTLAATRNASQSASVAATQVRRSYEGLVINADKIARSFGVATTSVDGSTVSLGELAFAIAETNASSQQIADTLTSTVGRRGFVPLVVLIDKAKKAIRDTGNDTAAARAEFFELRNEISNTTAVSEALSTRFRAMAAGNLEFQFNRLRVSLEQVAEGLGPILLEPIRITTDGLLRIADAINEVIEAVQDIAGVEALAPLISKITEATGALSVLGGIFGKTIGIIIGGRAAFALLRLGLGQTTAAAIANVFSLKFLTKAKQQDTVATVQNNATNATAAGIHATSATAATAQAGATLAVAETTTVAGVAARGAAGGFKALLLSFGPLGIAALLFSIVVDGLGLLGDTTEDLTDLVSADAIEGRLTAERLLEFGDVAGAAFLQAAETIRTTFEDPTPVVRAGLFSDLPDVLSRMQRLAPEFTAAIGPGFQTQMAGAQAGFEEFLRAMRAGEQIPIGLSQSIGNALTDMAVQASAVAGASDDEGLQRLAKEMRDTAAAITASSQSLDLQADSAERLGLVTTLSAAGQEREARRARLAQERREERAARQDFGESFAEFFEQDIPAFFGRPLTAEQTIARTTGGPKQIAEGKAPAPPISEAAEANLAAIARNTRQTGEPQDVRIVAGGAESERELTPDTQ